MKYIVTQRLDCAMAIPHGGQLEIDGFIFLRDMNGNNSAKYIKTEVDAHTEEEARRKARKRIAQFLPKITILYDLPYSMLGIVSVTDGTTTTVNRNISGRANIAVDGELIKDEYELIKNKRLRILPLQYYSDGINAIDPFDKFRNFYLVLENYLKETRDITPWIRKKLPKIEMKTDIFGKKITIISWIRHKLSHPKKNNKGLTPLSISKPEDVLLVQKHLPIIQKLAREIIREEEKI